MHRHRQGQQQPPEQMQVVGEVMQLPLVQPFLLHGLAAAQRQGQGQQRQGIAPLAQAPATRPQGIHTKQQRHGDQRHPHAAVQIHPIARQGEGQDRKSTRLNSSHRT